jgi:RimJ/RimL family protein N-acetyltransferase
MGHPYWPLFDLRVRTPRIELRYPNDDDVVALTAVAAGGIHPPDFMPFFFPWTAAPVGELERNTVQYFWRTRAIWTPAAWSMPLAVVRDGEVVGVQGTDAEKFSVTRAVTTGSWLGEPYQGQGIGKEMRAAVLHLAFAGLGAAVAYSGAFHDNAASLAVSKSLGYQTNGDKIVERMDEPARLINLKLARGRWDKVRRDDIVIEGLEPCLDLFGLAGG